MDRILDYLLATHGDVGVKEISGATRLCNYDRDRLRDKVRQGIARGRAFGLTWESTLAIFVTLSFVAAPNFCDHPAVYRSLTDTGVIPDLRIDLVTLTTTPQVWHEIEAAYDPGAWLPARASEEGF